MAQGLRDHPLRRALTEEVHARPFARLAPPQRATHLAMLSGEDATTADRAHVARLCGQFGAPPPGAEDTHLMADLGPFTLKWERHTEFSSYTFFQGAGAPDFDAGAEPFAAPVITHVPQAWLDGLAGELLVGIHLEMEPQEAPQRDADALSRLFETDNIAASLVSGGAAAIWMDFAVHADGFGRILVHDRGLRPRQAGRLVQRLFEIETYRMLALLALPVARQHGPDLTPPGQLGDLGKLNALNISGNDLSGSLPLELMNLNLSTFNFTDTILCEPLDAAFQAWLVAIDGPVAKRLGLSRPVPRALP